LTEYNEKQNFTHEKETAKRRIPAHALHDRTKSSVAKMCGLARLVPVQMDNKRIGVTYTAHGNPLAQKAA